MKYKILITAFCLGIIIGVMLFTQPEMRGITGSVPVNCYVENELCDCNAEECICGNVTVPERYCTQKE